MFRLRLFIANLMATVLVTAVTQSACHGQSVTQLTAELNGHVNKGNYLMARGSFQQAIEEYEAALQLDPNNRIVKENIVLAHNNWGIANFRQKKYEEAKTEWDKALQLNPRDRNAQNNLLYMKQQLAKRGVQLGVKEAEGKEKTEPKTAQEKVDENPETNSIKLLSPAFKTQPSAETTPFTPSTQEQPAGAPTATGPTPVVPQQSNSYTPITPRSRDAAESTYSPPASSYSSTTSTESKSTDTGSNALEDQLGVVEMKIYGHKQEDMPLLKRLEKVETDVCGKPRKGSLDQRIDAVKKKCGL